MQKAECGSADLVIVSVGYFSLYAFRGHVESHSDCLKSLFGWMCLIKDLWSGFSWLHELI